MIKLKSVYWHKDAPRVLLALMESRLADKQAVNISHKEMPTWWQHILFILSRRNGFWYLIIDDFVGPIGWVYLNKRNEIGIMLFPGSRGLGTGTEAIKILMEKHPRKRYLANINPANERSIKFFKRLGFKNCVQWTFERRT